MDTLLVSAIPALLVAASVAATIWLAYSKAERIATRFGPQGTVVATKLTAFLLLCIGGQIMMPGVLDALAPVIQRSAG